MNKIKSLIGMECYLNRLNDVKGYLMLAPNGVTNLVHKFNMLQIKKQIKQKNEDNNNKENIQYIGSIKSILFYANYSFGYDISFKDRISIVFEIEHSNEISYFSVDNNYLIDFLGYKNLMSFDGICYDEKKDLKWTNYFKSKKSIVCNHFSGMTQEVSIGSLYRPAQFIIQAYIKVFFEDKQLESALLKTCFSKSLNLENFFLNKKILAKHKHEADVLYKTYVFNFLHNLDNLKNDFLNDLNYTYNFDETNEDYILHNKKE